MGLAERRDEASGTGPARTTTLSDRRSTVWAWWIGTPGRWVRYRCYQVLPGAVPRAPPLGGSRTRFGWGHDSPGPCHV